MKNKEKYIDEFIEASCHDDVCGFINKYVQSVKELKDEEKGCWNGCSKYCMKELKKWLEQEYNPEPRLSYDEYVILKHINKTFKWITRDKCDYSINVHADKPKKKVDYWEYCMGRSHELIFNHLFPFIKWEDEEPYNIQELLKEYENYVINNLSL